MTDNRAARALSQIAPILVQIVPNARGTVLVHLHALTPQVGPDGLRVTHRRLADDDLLGGNEPLLDDGFLAHHRHADLAVVDADVAGRGVGVERTPLHAHLFAHEWDLLLDAAGLDVLPDAHFAGRHLLLPDGELLLAHGEPVGLLHALARHLVVAAEVAVTAAREEATIVEVVVIIEVAAARRAGADRARRHRVARAEVRAQVVLLLPRQGARLVGRQRREAVRAQVVHDDVVPVVVDPRRADRDQYVAIVPRAAEIVVEPDREIARAHAPGVDDQIVHLADVGAVGGANGPAPRIRVPLGDLVVAEILQCGDLR